MFGWPWARRGVLTCATIGVLLATLALGACSGEVQSQPGNKTTAGGSTTGGVIPGGGMAVRPCPGAVSDATQVGPLALTLTQSNAAGSLRVGEDVQVRLPASLHWTLANQPSNMTLQGAAGGQDSTLNVCFWTFKAQSAGSATLRFSGVQPCDQPGSCSNATTEQDFTITVS